MKDVVQALLTSPGPWRSRAESQIRSPIRLARRGFFRPRPGI